MGSSHPLPTTKGSKPRIDGLALQSEDAEHAFVDTPQRLALHEPLEPFDSQRELAQSQRTLSRKTALSEPLQMLGQRILRPVDDSQVLAPATLDRRLEQATRVCCDERQRFHNRAFAASLRQCRPPRGRGSL